MPSLNEIIRASRESGVQLTPQATSLVKIVLDAIVDDPNPRWRLRNLPKSPSREMLLDVQREALDVMPKYLFEVAQKEGAEKTVSTFGLLHWLGSHLDSLCPFDK